MMCLTRSPGAAFGRISTAATLLLLWSCAAASQTRPQTAATIVAAVESAMASAEAALRDGEQQIAESRYRDALMQAWMLIGSIELGDRRLAEARDAFRRASSTAVQADAARRSLAVVALQSGEAAEAVGLLTRLISEAPKDAALRRLLAQALVANGEASQAVQELEEARTLAPDDPEVAFQLASLHLRLKRVDAAARLFDDVARARPIPQTYVLIGRSYRDNDQYDRARAALKTAIARDPRVRRAHYYLATVALKEQGVVGLDEGILELRQELKVSPDDLLTHLRLGMALVEARQQAAALRHLELASQADPTPAEALYYLGRCHLALDRPADAVPPLRRALAAAKARDPDESRLAQIHYQLALALRRMGAVTEAETHFAEAQRSSASETEHARESLARYFADAPENREADAPPMIEFSWLAKMPAEARERIARRVKTAMARAYLNLGVMHSQGNRFARAAELFEEAAAADPAFPQVQYSLGVAYFNAKNYEKATAPLARAVAADPNATDARRMLALSWLNLEAYDKAAGLLAGDPQRSTEPSLQYAYGLALVRSGRSQEAERIFSQLLAAHRDSPELNVLMGQAHAQQGNYEAAIEALQRALALKADVQDANATLGTIYFKQGRLDEAAAALRAELAAHPGAVNAMHTLAAVLDLQGQGAEAVALLRSVLKAQPKLADARYLLGKILLAQGAAVEALDQLEAAARLAPDDANVHFQLAQAYRKSGRAELSQRHFEMYRQLKDKQRGKTP